MHLSCRMRAGVMPANEYSVNHAAGAGNVSDHQRNTSDLTSADRFDTVVAAVATAARTAGRTPEAVTLVAVSKTFDADAIRPVLERGHRVFGENRVQEAAGKWPAFRAAFPGARIVMAGEGTEALVAVDRDELAIGATRDARRAQVLLSRRRTARLAKSVGFGVEKTEMRVP